MIKSYHAHIYFDLELIDQAQNIRTRFIEAERVYLHKQIKVGTLHCEPVGPHTKPMFLVDFFASAMADVCDLLIKHRGKLNVLIHPNTGDEVADHTINAMWLGDRLDIDLSKL